MDGGGDQAPDGPKQPGRRAFPCAAYLFGMVMTAPVFTYFALGALDPTRGGRLPQGSVDPLLTFIVLPAAGALVGLLLVGLVNLAYRLWHRG
jgi:hypothetical protein